MNISVDIHAYLQTNYISVAFFTDNPSIPILTASEHPPGISVEIFRAIIICMTYGSVADINYTRHPQTFHEKFKQFDFSVAYPRTHHIRGGFHKDITDGTDVFTDEKYDL